MAKKKRTPQERTIDPAVQKMLEIAEQMAISTAFDRADMLAPCPIGADGLCCKNCSMGPCRLVKEGDRGICGATVSTIQARNFARMVAAGAAAHSDHGRDLVLTLKAAANGEAQGYEIRDVAKLVKLAKEAGIETNGRTKEEIANDLADYYLSLFGQQEGEILMTHRAPEVRQKIWREQGVMPRGIDREVVDTLHRTHIGDDQEAWHILQGAVRTALGDGWGGSMIATDVSDILFGIPAPNVSKINLGVLQEDMVNIVVHGHEPTLSAMLVAATQDPELIELAHSVGAKGINLAGICCTSNEILVRQGIPSVGNFLQQEVALITGAVEAMIVDVQCIMQSLGEISQHFHTELITTSPKVKIEGATHLEFDEHHALDQAKELVRRAIENFKNRKQVYIPKEVTEELVPGFSHEYIDYAMGGTYRGSFRPLNDAIAAGRLRGVAAIVGCNNPRTQQDSYHLYIAKKLLENDVLVVETGCSALASGKYGLLQGEAAMEYAGPGLREVCEALGIPPILHMGSCVDNSRILTVLSQMVAEGGIGDDISELPAVGLAPEWMSEKAISIGTYCMASGAYVIFGGHSPVRGSAKVSGSDKVARMMIEGWEETYGGKLEFVDDPDEMVRKTLEHIDKKRKALKLAEYDPSKFGRSGDRRIYQVPVDVPLAEREAYLYGGVPTEAAEATTKPAS